MSALQVSPARVLTICRTAVMSSSARAMPMKAKKRRLMKNCDTKADSRLSSGSSTRKKMLFSTKLMSAK